MYAAVCAYIRAQQLLQPRVRVLAGVSGGADSVALLHVLHRLRAALGFTLGAAHFNHRLRDQADADEALVRTLCADWDIPFIRGEGDVYALRAQWGVSLELAARRARHAFFAQTMQAGAYERLALAHHMGDQAETVLLRLLRGAGTLGLGAMRPVNGRIIRPFLQVDKAQIYAYCREHRLPWAEDATNALTDVPRNRVRNDLLPRLQRDYNPAITRALCRTAALAQQDEHCLQALAAPALARITATDAGVVLPVEALAELHVALSSRVLRAALMQAGAHTDMEQTHIAQLLRLCAPGHTGATLMLPGGMRAVRLAEGLLFCPADPQTQAFAPVALALPGYTHLPDGAALYAEYLPAPPQTFAGAGPHCQYLSADALTEGARVRCRLPGDRFYPLGAPGERKLKEYLIDRKVPRHLRAALPLVECRGRLLWVVGQGISQHARVRGDSPGLWRLRYIPYGEDCNHE